VIGGELPLAPVHSSEPLPKNLLLAAAHELRSLRLNAPVQMGQVVLAGILGSGVDIVASRPIRATAP
jgi:CxxC motif-containing protein